MPTAKAPKVRFRPWPKKKIGHQTVIDVDKMRQLYLNQSEYAWTKFCASKGFNCSARSRNEFPVRVWQQEWLSIQAEMTMEEFVTPGVETKKILLSGRLKYITHWNDKASNLKYALDTRLKQILFLAQLENDQLEKIAKGLKKKDDYKDLYTIKTGELVQMVYGQKHLMELEREALLMPQSEVHKLALPVKEVDPLTSQAEAEGDRLRSLGPLNLDGTPPTQDQVTAMLSQWIDQQAAPAEIAVDQLSPEDILNAPMTPLEEEDET